MFLTLNVNEKQMKKAAEGGYVIALDIAEKLVQDGIPFRTTHKVVGQLVQAAFQTKKSLSKLTTSEIKQSVKGTTVDSKAVAKIIQSVSVFSSLKERTSEGSSGFNEQKRMIADRIKKINAYRIGITKRDGNITNSLSNLSKKVKSLMK